MSLRYDPKAIGSESRNLSPRRGFTLVELLIVIAIIAILALIAIPNMLEAQVRSKVARAKADMRTIATAIESYAVDANHYPPTVPVPAAYLEPRGLTTPIAYITSIIPDPFRIGNSNVPSTDYEYNNVAEMVVSGNITWPLTDLKRYGDWRLASVGPGRMREPHIPYDPTNGTVSVGNVLRTQLSAEGRIGYTYWDPSNPTL